MKAMRQIAVGLMLLCVYGASLQAQQTVCDDNGGAGYPIATTQGFSVNVTLNLAGITAGYITDVNASTDISHAWVGDLRATLVSPTATSVKLFDRPGVGTDDVVGGPPWGCDGDDIDASFDDESANAPIENQCPGGSPVYSGDYQPHATPAGNALSNFDTEDPAGDWILSIIDNAGYEGGTVNEVCITVRAASLQLEKFVSRNSTCSDQLDNLTVGQNEDVYYCYVATNSGDEQFVVNAGDATDDQSIDISGLEGTYVVGQSRIVVQGPFSAGSTPIPVGTTVNLATITATGDSVDFPSSQTITAVDSATLIVVNAPVADLAIGKSHSGDFVVGQPGVYTISVSNNGPSNEPGPITVTDALPTGLSFVSGVGTGWSCSAVGQDVTCIRTGVLASGTNAADITLTVNVAAAAAPSVTNTASVAGTNFDNVAANDSDTDPTNVLIPDLSTSVKSVVDLNGGDANPGDTLRYTITINETGGAAAIGASVTDTIDALLTGFSVVSIPAGATDNSTPGTGPLDISGIDIIASGSVTIVFDVTISGTAIPGDTIDNTAAITNPAMGAISNATATTIIVSASSIPASGIKNLYPYYAGAGGTLQRIVPVANTNTNIGGAGGSATLVLTPVTQAPLTLASGVIQIPLCMDRQGPWGFFGRNVDVALDYVGGSIGVIGNQTQNAILTVDGDQFVTFNISLATDVTLNPNTAIRMTVTNNSFAANTSVNLRSTSCGAPARVELNANTVINVDSIDAYDAVYPGGVVPSSFVPNTTVFLRAVVSDPFGSFDINGANIEIIDPLGTTVQTSVAMPLVNDSGVDTATFEFQYTVPPAGPDGTWTVRVTANEGTEGTVSHLGITTFVVGSPSISMMKLVSTISDPVNAGSNPKAIPGAIVEFQITASNSGFGPADSNSVVITDSISSDLQLLLGNPANPIQFTNGSPVSGLTYTFIDLGDATDNIDFSSDGGTTFVTPSVDASGFDITVPPINFIRITPAGSFNGSTGSGDPSFTIRFRAQVR